MIVVTADLYESFGRVLLIKINNYKTKANCLQPLHESSQVSLHACQPSSHWHTQVYNRVEDKREIVEKGMD